MNRARVVALLFGLFVLAQAAPARADITAFWGTSSQPVSHPTRGVALGISLVVLGFEGEYSTASADPVKGVPSLRMGMINGLVQTPTRTQFYLTAGGGLYRQQLGTLSDTSIGTNIGGGLKFSLVGPLRVRLDYRVFNLRGSKFPKTPQRFYAGVNLSF
jgi:hypothetical protein